jgi:hypothetical protein
MDETGLLHHVGGFMGYERHVLRTLVRSEPNVILVREGLRAEGAGGVLRGSVVVDAHVAKIGADHGFDA